MKGEWDYKRLGDLANVTTGNSAPQDKSLFQDGTIPFFRTADAGRIRFGVIHESGDYLNDQGALGLRLFPPGTILFPKSGASTFLNHRVMLAREGCVSSHLAAIIPDPSRVLPKFLLYSLALVKAQDLVQDHAYPSLNLPVISGIEVPFPPLPEQQRIVAMLDEAFAGLATAKANAERNLHSARALYDCHLEAVFSRRDEGWVEHALGDLIEIQNGYAFKSDEYTDSGYFVIRIGNVQDGEISLNNPRYIRLADQKLERFVLEEGDILISLTGNIGRVGVIRVHHLPAVLNQRVARITVKNQTIERDFLFRFLSSRTFRAGLQDAGHGAAQQNVSTKEIESVLLSMPSRIEQRAAVDEFNKFDEEVTRLTHIYERKLAALEELKKSLLQQAFNGEL